MNEAGKSSLAELSEGEPAWDIARLFPNQGHWSEEEYLALNRNQLVEFSHGYVEVLPMPTMAHQVIVLFLYEALKGHVKARDLGAVLVASLPVRLWDGKFREPDVMFMSAAHSARMSNECWHGADLVMEVVSDQNRRHDHKTKRFEYARAGIPEYWIVDPLEAKITVLRLEEDHYVVHGEFPRGATATSVLLSGFGVNVNDVFDAKP